MTGSLEAQAIAGLVGAQRLLVALDFDGTLAPLVPNPAESRVLPQSAAAIRRLASIPKVSLALVSGRPAGDLSHLADPPEGTLLVGSHGAEYGIQSGGTAQMDPSGLSTAQHQLLNQIVVELEDLAGQADGAWVEIKPFSGVFHTRRLLNGSEASHWEALAAARGRQLGGHVLEGKKVVEVSVLPASKADALDRLRVSTGADRVMFAGDDLTDELALRTLHPPDLGIRVGSGPTAAQLRLAGPKEVAQFLTDLVLALT